MDFIKRAREYYDAGMAAQYRAADERETSTYQHYCPILRELSGSFGRRITVLEVGCGTGRYFHCLRAVERLVGIDVSPHMLEQARNPAHADRLDIGRVELERGDLFSLHAPTASFDLIYSIGVLGEFAPVDRRLLDRCFELLAPGGRLFFTAVDIHSRLDVPSNERRLLPRALRKGFPLLPRPVKRGLNRALSSCYLPEPDLVSLLSASQFASFRIARYEHSAGWQGAHWDCCAEKAQPAQHPRQRGRADHTEQ